MRNTMTYRDALRILDKDPKGLVVLDRALGGILSIATGGTSDTVLSIFDAQGRIIRIGRDVITDLRSQLQPSTRTQRTKRLEAALTALAVASYFEALHDADLPFAQQDLQLSRKDQAKLAGVESAKQLTSSPVDIDVPKPSPDLPYEEFLQTLLQWYVKLSARLSSFIQGLAIWDNLSESEREEAERLICTTLPQEALDRFEGLYIRLSTEVREFSLWASLQNDQATRRTVRRALSGVEDLLAEMSSHAAPADIANELVQAHTANLSRPILTEGETPSGMRLPTLEEGYLDPDFRVRTVSGEDLPADEAWWREADTRTDLTEYLAGTITSSTATTAPLVVLGQPGAGKSVLTKVLAARLPAADFLPIRVVLREVPAEADVQSQIEYAIRSATGERMQWPSVVRAAVGMTPIVLLDGLDELLQATGVSQSDYLMKVSQFQQREQDQGRAVVAVVTTRTAVANWCRYPSGSVALRLEPFRAEQIAEWVRLWNQHNTDYLQRRGLSVLPLDTVLRHEALASQPLLLLLLALYDADSNALQQGNGNRAGEPLDEASLYEQLLASFARREVLKNGEALAEDKIDQQVEQELQRLSLVALGIINRRRQWITEAELEEDLAALLGRREQVAQDFKTPLTEADVALSRFFFIERAQALRDGVRLQTFEFLHATFAEYLAARLTVHLVMDLVAQRPALSVLYTPASDDLLYALLSFAPLSSRQILRFVRAILASRVESTDLNALADVLIAILSESAVRAEHKYANYLPRRLELTSRHGIYSANLVLLSLALRRPLTARELFPDASDPADKWHRRALVWRSSLSELNWTELADVLDVRHIWRGTVRDLSIHLRDNPAELPEPVDPYWLFNYWPGHEQRTIFAWYRHYWDEFFQKVNVAGGRNDAIVRHALEPVFRWLGPTVTTFFKTDKDKASSVMHELMGLALCGTFGSDSELLESYRACDVLIGPWQVWDSETRRRVAVFLLDRLRKDADRLPPSIVVRYVDAAVQTFPGDRHIMGLALQCITAALAGIPTANTRKDLIALETTIRKLLHER